MDTSERAIVKRELQRRRRSLEEKRRIVEETLEPDASVAGVVRAHGVNANQVFHWRRQYRQVLLGEGNAETVQLVPVQVKGRRYAEPIDRSGEQPRGQLVTVYAAHLAARFRWNSPRGEFESLAEWMRNRCAW